MNCSPLLSGTLRHPLSKYVNEFPEAIAKIIRSLYVDDFAGGSKNASSAYQLGLVLRDVLKRGGFEVHKLVSNDQALNEKFQVDGKSDDETKVLGVQLSPKSDTISVKFEGCRNENQVPTKRHILSALAK